MRVFVINFYEKLKEYCYVGIKVILWEAQKITFMKKTTSQVVKSPRIIYHEIKLSMKSGSSLESTLTTSYALHSLETTKDLFENEIKTEWSATTNRLKSYCLSRLFLSSIFFLLNASSMASPSCSSSQIKSFLCFSRFAKYSLPSFDVLDPNP